LNEIWARKDPFLPNFGHFFEYLFSQWSKFGQFLPLKTSRMKKLIFETNILSNFSF